MKGQVIQTIKFQGDLTNLAQSVKEAGGLFKKLKENGAPPSGLVSSYEKIVKTLDKLTAKTKDGVFKGTDAEYANVIRMLDSIGVEFETFGRILSEIGGMDDDAISKFLTKEDL